MYIHTKPAPKCSYQFYSQLANTERNQDALQWGIDKPTTTFINGIFFSNKK